MTRLAETILNRTPEEAYTSVKGLLAQSKSRIVSEEAPHKILAKQGSVWGTTAKNAQKNVTFTFQEDASGTKVSSKSVLTSGYIILTAVGHRLLSIFNGCLRLDCGRFASLCFDGCGGFLGVACAKSGFF